MSIIEEITKLKSLFDQGAISQEEFNSLKKRLLSEEINEKDFQNDSTSDFQTITTDSQTNSLSQKKFKLDGQKQDTTLKSNLEEQGKVSKIKFIKKFILPAIILIALVFIFYPSTPAWEKKQFDSYDEIVEAFKNVQYKYVKEKFGEPSYKYLDIKTQEITYRWHGVGVKGHEDAYLNFDVLEYAPGFFMGYLFKTVQGYEGYYAPSNDNFYNID